MAQDGPVLQNFTLQRRTKVLNAQSRRR